jgi:hypothetical protein
MRSLILILALFLLLGVSYALTTPVFEASDELWHYPLVKHLADGNPLPVQDPGNPGPWKQEASQQPLYYALAAALTAWVDTRDMDEVRWLNPHVDNGVITMDGNTNLAVHPSLPAWRGTILAVRIVRLVSVLMGVGTVWLTWCLARIVFPGRPDLPLAAAAVNAFTPMFLFISGAVNNDNLAVLLCSSALLLMLRNWEFSQRNGSLPLRRSLALGIVMGFGALTKTSALGLIPLALVSCLVSRWRQWSEKGRRRWLPEFLRRGAALLIPTLVIAGWWYARNVRLYGDWLGWNAFIQVLGRRAQPANPVQLWGERWGFSLSYWGLFGGVNVPMADWIYRTLNTIAVVGAFGLLVWVGRQVWRAVPRPGRLPVQIMVAVERLWPTALLSGWTVAVMVGLVRWATVTWSSQGRLVFPAISAISILLVGGLFGWLPRRVGGLGSILLAAFLFVISAAAPLAWIAPAYRPPTPPSPAEVSSISHPKPVDLGPMRLLGYDLPVQKAAPGGQLEITLYWEVLAPMEQDWSVFVHLNDPVIGAPVAQRDMYLGQGLQPTSLLTPGQQVRNRYVVQVAGTTYSPTQAELVVGMYSFETGERLHTVDGADAVFLAPISVAREQQTTIENPVFYNFGNQMALRGYKVVPRRLRPGDTLILTLYWEALADMDIDYTVFTHVRDLEDPSNRIYAQLDAPAPGGTSNWLSGQLVEAVYELQVAADTPASVHEVEVGVYYWTPAGALRRLQLRTEDGRLVDDYLILSKVRVD